MLGAKNCMLVSYRSDSCWHNYCWLMLAFNIHEVTTTWKLIRNVEQSLNILNSLCGKVEKGQLSYSPCGFSTLNLSWLTREEHYYIIFHMHYLCNIVCTDFSNIYPSVSLLLCRQKPIPLGYLYLTEKILKIYSWQMW